MYFLYMWVKDIKNRLSMEVVGIIVLSILAFVSLGLIGWGDFLLQGCSSSFGCIF